MNIQRMTTQEIQQWVDEFEAKAKAETDFWVDEHIKWVIHPRIGKCIENLCAQYVNEKK